MRVIPVLTASTSPDLARSASELFSLWFQVKKMADETDLDISDQINSLEDKYQQVLHVKNMAGCSGTCS